MLRKLFMFIMCALNVHHDQKCRLNSRIHFHEPLPVIIRNGRLLEPTDNEGTVVMNHGEVITLSCDGGGYIEHTNVKRACTIADISCEYGEYFSNSNLLTYPSLFSEFRCTQPPLYFSRRSNRTCYAGNIFVEVGYQVQDIFYPVYESCFNEPTSSVIYTRYVQKPCNVFFQQRVSRPYYKPDDQFGSVPVDILFSPSGQKAAVAESVGPMVNTYISTHEFLSRGHLAAKTDFIYAFGERATFHYVNCAPQFAMFNGGNWNALEVDLRKHIHTSGYTTIIYTGVYGVTTLCNHFGRRVEIYLYRDCNNNPIIPVPLYFYKVVFEPETLSGIVFIGINNPYYKDNEYEQLVFCKDICRGSPFFTWLSWRPNDRLEGYSFCCTIPDFRQTVKHLPDFEVRNVLI